MERNPYIQAAKYIIVSATGAFFITAVISNLLANPFEAAIAFNWICAAHILTSDRSNRYHYVILIALALLIGSFVFATALAPLWLFSTLATYLNVSGMQLQQLHPYSILILNGLVSSAYMLRSYRKLGTDPAKDFM